MTNVITVLLDAAIIASNWIVVDRTGDDSSAAAELLIELAIKTGKRHPKILVIDSFERLAEASKQDNDEKVKEFIRKEGDHLKNPSQLEKLLLKETQRSQRTLRRLTEIVRDTSAAVASADATHKEVKFDFLYGPEDYDEYEELEDYGRVPDDCLPFEVRDGHRGPDGKCKKDRKWSYFYEDAMFSSGTHYVIKNKNADDFELSHFMPMGYVYANGGSRTGAHIRASVQQGKQMVMLYNSGGVTQAWSWLQRVMANHTVAPPIQEMREPLYFILGAVSDQLWTHTFGVPEMLIIKGLAERVPQLFRKNIVSVDLLNDSEEQMLQVITSCFASGTGGVPELGLGDAEVNIVWTAWQLHYDLCVNAADFYRSAWISQIVLWLLGIITTFVAVVLAHMRAAGAAEGSEAIQDEGEATGVVRDLLRSAMIRALGGEMPSPDTLEGLLARALIILPLITGGVTTISTRMGWKDKYSVVITAAHFIVQEIYAYRMKAGKYDLLVAESEESEEEDGAKMSDSQRRQRARQAFVDEIQTRYSAALADITSGSLRRGRRKVSPAQRSLRENKMDPVQWVKLKQHVEKHFYGEKHWKLPPDDKDKKSTFGLKLDQWLTGLRPYVSTNLGYKELQQSILGLSKEEEKLVLKLNRIRDAEAGKKAEDLEVAAQEATISMPKQGVAEWLRRQASQAKLFAPRPPPVAPQPSAGLNVDKLDLLRKDIERLANGLDEHPEEDLSASQLAAQFLTVEDDYLSGPMSVETYVVFRVRPCMEELERTATRVAARLNLLETIAVIVFSTGSVLAVLDLSQWVALTVIISVTIVSIMEFSMLRNTLIAINIALAQLQSLITAWDSMSLVTRRLPSTRDSLVRITESSLANVLDAKTTAASKSQSKMEDSKQADELDNAAADAGNK